MKREGEREERWKSSKKGKGGERESEKIWAPQVPEKWEESHITSSPDLTMKSSADDVLFSRFPHAASHYGKRIPYCIRQIIRQDMKGSRNLIRTMSGKSVTWSDMRWIFSSIPSKSGRHPIFPVESDQIEILKEPSEFYLKLRVRNNDELNNYL